MLPIVTRCFPTTLFLGSWEKLGQLTVFQKVLGIRGQKPNNVRFSFYGLKKGHARLCLRTSTVETSELIMQGKVESRKVFNAEFEVSERSLVPFPLFLFYTTQHCWDGVGVHTLGVVSKRPPPVHVVSLDSSTERDCWF